MIFRVNSGCLACPNIVHFVRQNPVVLHDSIAESVALQQRPLHLNLVKTILILMDLKANLALLVELRYCGFATITVEDILWQCIDGRTEALMAIGLLDLIEKVRCTELSGQYSR